MGLTSDPTKRVFAMRHGRYSGGPDGALTAEGRQQVIAAAEALSSKVEGGTSIWTSMYPRAIETGAIVSAAVGVAPETHQSLGEENPAQVFEEIRGWVKEAKTPNLLLISHQVDLSLLFHSLHYTIKPAAITQASIWELGQKSAQRVFEPSL